MTEENGRPAGNRAANDTANVTTKSISVIQPMPNLTPEQLDSLRADIADNGVLVPVVVDQHGRILDGNHRATIATELGLDYPTLVVTVKDDADAWDRAVALNCSRRHMTREQVREVIKAEIHRRPDDSDRAIARRVGCSPSTVGSVRTELRAEIEDFTQEIRDAIETLQGQLMAQAMLNHLNDGYQWQQAGDILERLFMGAISSLDTGDLGAGTVAVSAPFRRMWAEFFDAIRAYDCPPTCQVCTDEQRAWRDSHPRQVNRSAVSDLDTEAAAKAVAR